MSIDLTQVEIECDGTGNVSCCASPTLRVKLESVFKYFSQYEWGRPLEENIGKLFKTYHDNLDDVYEDNLETPPELEGWTFESDGIVCVWVRCPYCSSVVEDNRKGE